MKMHCQNGAIPNLIVALFLLNALIPIAVLGHKYGNGRSVSPISHFRGCGSRMTDALRFMCQSKMWKPNTCSQAQKIFCRSRSHSTHPICHFNCMSARASQNLIADFTDNNIRVTKTQSGNGFATKDVQSRLQYFHDRSKKNAKSPQAHGRSHNMNCCRTSCSIQVLSELCTTSN